jgi:fructokinase
LDHDSEYCGDIVKEQSVVVGIGEVLWDMFPEGARFGGAPANFVCSFAGLAKGRWPVAVVSAVGEDELGEKAVQSMVEHQVDVQHISSMRQSTGQVHVQLDDRGHASYEFATESAWDYLEWSDSLQKLATRTAAVCFGTLGQRHATSRATIRRFVNETPSSALRIFDINIRKPYIDNAMILESMQLANVLKMNQDELPVLADLYHLSGSDASMLKQLQSRFSLRLVALTRGDEGALIVRGEDRSDLPGVQTQVVDTVGAGDAFTAMVALGLLQGLDLDTINRKACEVASFVCMHSGATPRMPDYE